MQRNFPEIRRDKFEPGGAVLIARPPRGWREVGARIAELIERRLLCPDDPAAGA
jgi:hypothetical protein